MPLGVGCPPPLPAVGGWDNTASWAGRRARGRSAGECQGGLARPSASRRLTSRCAAPRWCEGCVLPQRSAPVAWPGRPPSRWAGAAAGFGRSGWHAGGCGARRVSGALPTKTGWRVLAPTVSHRAWRRAWHGVEQRLRDAVWSSWPGGVRDSGPGNLGVLARTREPRHVGEWWGRDPAPRPPCGSRGSSGRGSGARGR